MAWQTSATIVLCAVLGGCSTPRASWFPPPAARTPLAAPGPLDFNWTLSGEKQVGPLQVFSDGMQTWLQWRPNQPLPAVLVMHQGGYAVVDYRRQDPYTIIEGVYPSLLFRAGHHWATASRGSLSAAPPGNAYPNHAALPHAASGNPPLPDTSQTRLYEQTGNPAHPTRLNAAQVHHRFDAHSPKAQVAFAVSRADQHLRQALGRWANLSGWRFDPEHWSVDVDIPVSAEASFSDDFVDSVQALLSSTELSDRPVQPCFYTNQVLRVIPMAEACDRTVVAQESA